MKWSQEKVEERLLSNLKELGGGHNKVEESLEAKHILGYISYVETCPIAKYVKKIFKSATNIEVEYERIFIRLADTTYMVTSPVAVRKFIDNFDEGKYPKLAINDQ